MPTTCLFLYDRPNSVYYSGEVLNGKIVLKTDTTKKVRGIYITIKGEAKVRWTERKSRQNHHTNEREYYTVEYRGDQQYLHSRTLVEGEIDLPPGTHEYTFSSPLPIQVPSSISDEHGHVAYEVELKLDRPMRPDNIYSNAFTVIRSLNLNLDPAYAASISYNEYKQAITDEDEKTFCCFCCTSGSVNSELRTEFAGYAPGQKIHFTVTIENESNNDISECTVDLVQRISFESQSPEHKVNIETHVLGSSSLSGANRLSKKVHSGTILVPPVPPTTVSTSDIIKISYALKADIETGFCSTNIELNAPVTIGTVPLVVSASNPNSVITIQPTAPTTDTTEDNDDKPPQYGSIVPPSFEEATGMNKPFKDAEANENRVMDPYVPKYPTYHNFAVPSAPNDEQIDPNLTAPSQQELQGAATSQRSNLPPYPVHGFTMPMAFPVPTTAENIDDRKGVPDLGWRS